jgi:hypothetical protein
MSLKRRFELPTDEELNELTELGRQPPVVLLPSAAAASSTALGADVPAAVASVPAVPVVSAVVAPPVQSKPRATAVATSSAMTSFYDKTVKVNPNQTGNPVLRHIKNVPVQFEAGIAPDFVVGELRFEVGPFLSRLTSAREQVDVHNVFEHQVPFALAQVSRAATGGPALVSSNVVSFGCPG